jgi:hypothetical protein
MEDKFLEYREQIGEIVILISIHYTCRRIVCKNANCTESRQCPIVEYCDNGGEMSTLIITSYFLKKAKGEVVPVLN